ncbi:MAG: protein-L-isoaspartate(D-aspartate) O-methyltransferase [Candidatus Kaelpia aquatica]|nr:protein-L-isoaspartate(D-aspartate) O-methyltransferase [Candidatus Kaelpia aquatica]
MNGFKSQLLKMVESQIQARGIKDNRLLLVMKEIDRAAFVPESARGNAYIDSPLLIEDGQTISQPFIVALMTEALSLTREDRVLEIGTGSGYQTAILSLLSKEVYTVERISLLIERAEPRLKDSGCRNIFYKLGDGSMGWEKHAPYDKIMVAAASKRIPELLIQQLNPKGKIVIPLGDKDCQKLTLGIKEDDGIKKEVLCDCSFVPLIGEYGFQN